MRRGIVLAALIAIGALSITAMAVTAPQAPQGGLSPAALAATKIEKVKDNLYMITGSDPTDRSAFAGGNTGVFITNSGVIVVDTKLAGWGQVLLDRIKTVTDKPVTTIINTHTHGDHTGSNNMFPASIEIVAHENTKANMEKMDAFKGDNAKFLPKKTYKDKMSLGSGKDRVDLYYFGRGHTNGDAWIVFPDLRVAHAGDIFSGKNLPLLDMNNGGSGVEIGDSLMKAHDRIKNVDQVITGHSTVMTWSDVAEYAQFNKDFLRDVRAAAAGGKTADQFAATWKRDDKYKGYNVQDARLKTNAAAVYKEIGK